MAMKKLALDTVILSRMDAFSLNSTSLGVSKKDRAALAQEIDNLLRYGAYDLFHDDKDGKEKKSIESEDIEEILKRTSRVVRYDQEERKEASFFSKATFKPSNVGEVEIDDPQFWKKVHPHSQSHTHTVVSLDLSLSHTLSLSLFLPLLVKVLPNEVDIDTLLQEVNSIASTADANVFFQRLAKPADIV